MSLKRSMLRVSAATAGAGVLLVTGALGAAAHVTVTPSTTAAGAYTVLTFSVPHGCETSPTTKVAIKMPEPLMAVTPTVNPGWTVQKVMVKLPAPVDDGHGGQYTERVDQVVYTARTPLPADMRDTFELSLKLPETDGETLTFPAVQTCQQGESAWVQVPPAGRSGEELELPAPSFELTAAEDEPDAPAGQTAAVAPVAAADDDATAMWLGAGGLVAGLLGLALGGTALARSRRS